MEAYSKRLRRLQFKQIQWCLARPPLPQRTHNNPWFRKSDLHIKKGLHRILPSIKLHPFPGLNQEEQLLHLLPMDGCSIHFQTVPKHPSPDQHPAVCRTGLVSKHHVILVEINGLQADRLMTTEAGHQIVRFRHNRYGAMTRPMVEHNFQRRTQGLVQIMMFDTVGQSVRMLALMEMYNSHLLERSKPRNSGQPLIQSFQTWLRGILRCLHHDQLYPIILTEPHSYTATAIQIGRP